VVQAAIQADDLTGACDTGAVFAARGLATVVLLPEAPAPATLPEVLVVDTESRSRAPAAARACARAAAARLAALEPRLVYKKVDSTLRGPLAAELAGALEAAGRSSGLLAPALPAQKRTLVDGTLWVDGQPAATTAVARDPAFPPTGASALALLACEGVRPVTPVALATVRRGPTAVRRRLERHDAAFVCDAETDADLAVVAAAADGWPGLLAGSAGLAAALAARLPGAVRGRPRVRGPLLVVAGSAHPVTARQVSALAPRGIAMVAPSPDGGSERDAILVSLAAAARAEIERRAPRSVLLTGGETAYAVCRALGATAIALEGEIEPGIAVGHLLGGSFEGLTVMTKAGGFGDPDTLVRIDEAVGR
jgi:uncharacterized protein YgbK (DUF1537 family)